MRSVDGSPPLGSVGGVMNEDFRNRMSSMSFAISVTEEYGSYCVLESNALSRRPGVC